MKAGQRRERRRYTSGKSGGGCIGERERVRIKPEN
jgi:hypothetical protein